MPSSGTLSARLGKLVRFGKPEEKSWDEERLLAHIASLETVLARYVAKYGLTPEARHLFAQPPLPSATLREIDGTKQLPSKPMLGESGR